MVVGELAVGVVSELIVAGLSRVGSLAVNKALRLQKIDSAIRGQAQSNDAMKTCLSDFKTLIGTRYATLTQNLDAFLKELEKSGLITAMAEQATLGRRVPSVEVDFLRLHHVVMGSTNVGAAAQLYNQLATAFEVSISALIDDPALALTLSALGKSIETRISALEERISETNQEKSPFETYDVLSGFLQRLVKALLAQYRLIRIETNKGAKFVDLQKIYTPSKLRHKRGAKFIDQLAALGVADQKAVRSPGNAPLSKSLEQGIITFADFQGSLNRAVVLGDPGGGKSTLCQYLCYQLAKNYGFCMQYPDEISRHGELQSARIPIRIVLRNFEVARVKQPQLSIFEYITNEIRNLLTSSEEEAQYALSFGLSLGKVVLAFDGLDEILNTSIRRDFVAIVLAFCEEYPLCPVFVTSRIVGYEDASLPGEFDELMLDRFEEAEIRNFVNKFLRVVSNLNPEEARSGAEKFILQTARTAGDLRQNPLMLGLMAFLFANKGDVPTNRPEIYQECAILMFEKWDQNRNIRADVPVGFNLLDLLSEIASRIYSNAELEEGVDSKWLEEVNKQYFGGLFESTAKANDAAKKVTAFLTGRSWVMSEVGADVYRFTHRTFLEYFFARHLGEEYETVQQVILRVVEKVVAKQWDVISHLSLQIKTFRSQRRTAQAITELISRVQDSSIPLTERFEIARFAANSLQYLMGAETELRLLLQGIYEVCLEFVLSTDEATIAVATTLASGCSCVSERRDYVTSVIADLLADTVNLSSGRQTDFALGLVSTASQGDWSPFAASTGLFFPDKLASVVKTRVRRTIEQRAEHDAFYARVQWEWYGTGFSELFERHQLAMLFADRRPQEIIPSRPDPGFEVMHGWRAYGWNDRRNAAEWKEEIRAVGRWGGVDWKWPTPRGSLRPIATPFSFWIKAIRKGTADLDTLRGTLLCFAIHTDFLHKIIGRKWSLVAGEATDLGRQRERFCNTIDAAISSAPSSERIRFEFWDRLKREHLVELR